MNWLVYLRGSGPLMNKLSESIPEEFIMTGPDERYALRCGPGEDLEEAEVLRIAEEKIGILNGISRLVLNENPRISIEGITRYDPEVTNLRGGIREKASCGMIIVTEDGEEEFEINNPVESVLIAAGEDPDLNCALGKIGNDFDTWGDFLEVDGLIESCKGDPVGRGWCPPEVRDWFLLSARRQMDDDQDSEKSCGLMYLSEAESFVTMLMQEWIKEVIREKEELNS